MQNIVKLFLLACIVISCSKEEEVEIQDVKHDDHQNVDSIPHVNETAYYTGNINQLPKFVKVCYFEYDSISKISKFRSGFGHDYSDDFEYCRSMKHYFVSKYTHTPSNRINIYSPFHGVVDRLWQEWAGSQIHIVSTEYPAFAARLFHVNLNPGISVGDTIYEGQLLGTHIGSMTASDIAITVLTPTDGSKDSTISQSGMRFVSYFSIMADTLLDRFKQRGLLMDSLIIPEATRDSDPLNCNGEAFTTQGTIYNWVDLQ